MWETFFVCKPVCQWLDIRVSFSDGLLVGCSFLEKDCETDNSDLLKTEIAYDMPIFTAVTRNHGDRKFVIFLQPYLLCQQVVSQ